MIKPICEKGKICVYLIKNIRSYSYSPFPRNDYKINGVELCYFCDNPKKFDSYRLPKKLTHEEKFRMCKEKVTNKLDEFIKS